jgi:hypothetical protein
MKRVLVLIVSLTFAATGCGSSSESATSSAPSTAATSTAVATATTGATTTTASTTTAPPTTAAATTTAAPTTTATAQGVPKPPANYVQPAATPADCAPGGPGDHCYTATVPVDPTHPAAGTLKLAVTARRAGPATWTSPVLIFNQQAVGLAFGPPPAPTYFAGHDLVWIDGRGVGHSDGAVDCSELDKLPGQLGTANIAAPGLGIIKDCFAKAAGSSVPLAAVLDHDLGAADIIAVRHALGIERWAVNAAGPSTDLAVRLVGADADGTTALVVRTPQAVGQGMSPTTINEAFESYAADCAASVNCAQAGDLHTLLAAVAARPLRTTDVKDRDGSPVLLDKLSTQLGIAGAMSNTVLAPILPTILAAPDDGGTAAANAFVANGFPSQSAGTLASWCQNGDYVYPGLSKTDDSKGGPWVGTSYKRLCDAIGPIPQMRPLGEVTSKVPVLVVLVAYDGRSDRDTAMKIFRNFSNLTMLTIPHMSDPSAQLPCFNPMRTSFIEHPDTKLDTACVDASTFKTFL